MVSVTGWLHGSRNRGKPEDRIVNGNSVRTEEADWNK
jgi:hypothetical protein